MFIDATTFLDTFVKAPLIGLTLVPELARPGAAVLMPATLVITEATVVASWRHNRGKGHGENNDDGEAGPVVLTAGPVEKVS